jgi:hypothetical protein
MFNPTVGGLVEGALIVNPENEFEMRVAVATVMVRVVVAAPGAIEIVIGSWVLLPTPLITAVTPVPLKLTALTPLRLMPFRVADVVVPWSPDVPEIEVRKGAPVPTPGGLTVRMLFA